MKFSETSEWVLTTNNISEEKQKEFIKELRLALRLDYGLSATDVRKMNDNKVIEEWFRIHSLPENRIGGACL